MASLSEGRPVALIAEDEPLVRAVAVRLLRRAGFETLEAPDGREAVCMFEEHGERIDVVLLDAVMPGMSGLQAFRRIRRMAPHVPVIFCTGYSRNQVPQLAGAEAVRVLLKPFAPERLIQTVRESLGEAFGGEGEAAGRPAETAASEEVAAAAAS